MHVALRIGLLISSAGVVFYALYFFNFLRDNENHLERIRALEEQVKELRELALNVSARAAVSQREKVATAKATTHQPQVLVPFVDLRVCNTSSGGGLTSPNLPLHEYVADLAFFERHIREYRALTGRCPPQGFDRWLVYARQNKCLTSVANYTQIEKDLAPFRNSQRPNDPVFVGEDIRAAQQQARNSRLMGMQALKSHEHWKDIAFLLHDEIQLVENQWDEPMSLQVDACCNPMWSMGDAYARSSCLAKRYPRNQLPASHNAYFHCPSTFTGIPNKIPIFSATKIDCFNDIVIPTSYHTNGPRWNDKTPWRQKRNTVFWRGSTTGGQPRSPADFGLFPRLNLAKWANENKHNKSLGYSIDVAISAVIQCGGWCHAVQQQFGLGNRVPMEDNLANRYLIVVEGNTFVSRLASQLGTKSLVLFHTPTFVEWHTERIHAWEHYVPFKIDMSDLSEKMQWALQHQEEAEQVALRAEALVHNHVRLADMKCYTALLLLEYQTLLTKR